MSEEQKKTPNAETPAAKEDELFDDPVMREFSRDPALAEDARRLARSRREVLRERLDGDEEDEPASGGKRPGPRRRRRRPLWVALLMIITCVYFLSFLHKDVGYFLASDDPQSLGEAPDFKSTSLASDTYVTITGVRNPSRGVKLEGFVNRNVFQLVGTRLVLVDTNADKETKGEMLETRTFAGRLLRFRDTPYYRSVRDFALERYGVEIPAEAIVVRVDERPGDYWYMALCAVALSGILLFNLIQVFLAIRRPRP